MAEENQNPETAEDQNEAASESPEQQEDGDPRQGYISVETGSTKHPDAEDAEDGKVTAKIGVFVGDTLREAVEEYGEEFVYNNYVRQVVVTTQGKVRRELDAGAPVSSVEENFDDLDPTEKRSTVQDPQAQAMRALKNMDEEQKEKFRQLVNQGDV